MKFVNARLPFFVSFLAIILFFGCSKNETIHSREVRTEVNNLSDTSKIKLDASFTQMGENLPTLNYLLNKYDLSYEQVFDAVKNNRSLAAFQTGEVERYADWELLRESLIKCEIAWHDLTQKYPGLQTKEALWFTVENCLKNYQSSNRSGAKTEGDGDGLDVGPNGEMRAVTAGGPINLPVVIVNAVALGAPMPIVIAPGRGGNSFSHAMPAEKREEWVRRLEKLRTRFAEEAQLDENKRPKALKANDIIKCYNDGKPAKEYRLTLYIDQPTAGAANAIDMQTRNVGHTFIGLEKINTDGTKVIKVFGFYPTGEGKGAAFSKGTLRDNEEHAYDVSVTRTFTDQTSFNVLVDKIKEMDNRDYLLFGRPSGGTFKSSFNCTDAANEMAVAGGMTIPSGFGFYFGPFLPGNSPGRFGEEVRKDAASPRADILGQQSQSYNTSGGNAPKNEGCQ